MTIDYKKFDLFGKTLIQKVELKPPFEFVFPVAEQACFLYMLKGEMEYQSADDRLKIPTHHALLLNCINSGKQIQGTNSGSDSEIVIVTFHPDILKKVYDKEIPLIFKPNNQITNQSRGAINNDFLIQKYIEGLLFYFENPSLVNDEILVLKLKEIILLLSQTQGVETIQVILSQLFSPTTYTFKQIIEANLFSPISVEDLAQKINLSVSSFKREFKKLYNDSPANYIKTKRLERAAELLLASNERITDIAFECGFNDLANFTKSFHDRFSTSPSNYRLKQKEG
ncbi:AraC family transcriptional regulator [Niastella koreensis]|uniref:Transcriptional regulator, AraC family n=2 Tax=Niastella koreensis TaxID=354356 RepID=G8TAF4_NIAKG|nr:AraC family transcriptional regulator [Niastella koreensis]AEV98116.1 transcriptional regulator, AraC family [Niastella koreensis GR20-10]OQP45327.1 AraC family transcriptional regulator [Niastella koreensis]